MMQVDQNNDPILLDELPAINGYVSSIVRTSSNTFITGSQDCTFRGWEIRDDQFIGNFNILTEAPIKCVSINQDHTLTGKLFLGSPCSVSVKFMMNFQHLAWKMVTWSYIRLILRKIGSFILVYKYTMRKCFV